MSYSMLPLAWAPLFDDASFYVSKSNEEAFRWIQTWPLKAPLYHLCIWGPAGSGKTHLGSLWARRCQGVWLPSVDAHFIHPGQHYIVDLPFSYILQNSSENLLHFLEAVREQKCYCLWLSETATSQWPIICSSTSSRLTSIPCIEIQQPDDTLLKNVFRKAFFDRGMDVPEPLILFLVQRAERSFHAIRRLVERIHLYTLQNQCPISMAVMKKNLLSEDNVE